MNCVTAECKHLKLEKIETLNCLGNGKVVLYPYCELGHNATYPFIDEGQDLQCKDYCKVER